MPILLQVTLEAYCENSSVGATTQHLFSSLTLQGESGSLTHPALSHVTVLGQLLLYSLVTCQSGQET